MDSVHAEERDVAMTFLEFEYKVLSRVRFTKAEYTLLITLAQGHYDSTCLAAGLGIGEQVRGHTGLRNGFIAQLKLFPTTPQYSDVTWSWSEFDLTMKVLEQRTYLKKPIERATADGLARIVSSVMNGMNVEYRQLLKRGKN